MSTYEFLQHIDRRTFLRIASFTGIAGLIYPRHVISSFIPTEFSRVVIVEDETATSGLSISQDTVQVMVDRGVKSLVQQQDISKAWKVLLPGIHENHTVALKVNCINSSMPTHPTVTYAVAESLKQMVFGAVPFPENNIIIFDRWTHELRSSGYEINTSNTGIRCFGTDGDNSNQSFDIYGKNRKLSKIITEKADFLINVSVLKNHGTSGVTLCLKNHYGSCNQDNLGYHLHGNNCDPYIPALNALEPILTKQKLNICDALFGIKSGGPSGNPQFVANKIIMSQDIVAVDYWGRKILKDNGCYTVSRARHIDTAAKSYRLGTNDPSQMDVVDIQNPTADISRAEHNFGIPGNFVLQQNFPNPFNNHTQVRFYIANPIHAKLTIFNSSGRQVRTLVNQSMDSGWHQVVWDGYNHSGKQVASGVYICQLTAGEFKKSIIMQLVK